MQKLSGILIFISFISTLYSYFIDESFLIFSAFGLWISATLLFLSLKNKNVVLSLLGLSVVFFTISFYKGYQIDFIKAFSINQYLITLLIGVGFLRLIITPKKEEVKNKSMGKSGFIKTYLSLHLFGSMINISAFLIMADKLYKKTSKLSNLQLMLLTRAFSSDAYWSPFFVAFGATITFAPNLDIFYTSISGVLLAIFTFVVTYFDMRNFKELPRFEGYPLNISTLFIPFSLAFLVLFVHYFYEDIKIIVLISFLAFSLAVVIPILKDGVIKTYQKHKTHICFDLPNMKSEISLFLVAGMFGVSVSSILDSIGFILPFNHYDYIIASSVLLLFIVLSFIGIHPIISISIFGHMLAQFDQTLVAMTFLMAWGLTVSTSPFSGVNLTLSSRYGVNLIEVLKVNISYLIKAYIFCIVLLYIVQKSI